MSNYCSTFIAFVFLILFTLAAIICGTLLHYGEEKTYIYVSLTGSFTAGAFVFVGLFIYSLYQDLRYKPYIFTQERN